MSCEHAATHAALTPNQVLGPAPADHDVGHRPPRQASRLLRHPRRTVGRGESLEHQYPALGRPRCRRCRAWRTTCDRPDRAWRPRPRRRRRWPRFRPTPRGRPGSLALAPPGGDRLRARPRRRGNHGEHRVASSVPLPAWACSPHDRRPVPIRGDPAHSLRQPDAFSRTQYCDPPIGENDGGDAVCTKRHPDADLVRPLRDDAPDHCSHSAEPDDPLSDGRAPDGRHAAPASRNASSMATETRFQLRASSSVCRRPAEVSS